MPEIRDFIQLSTQQLEHFIALLREAGIKAKQIQQIVNTIKETQSSAGKAGTGDSEAVKAIQQIERAMQKMGRTSVGALDDLISRTKRLYNNLEVLNRINKRIGVVGSGATARRGVHITDDIRAQLEPIYKLLGIEQTLRRTSFIGEPGLKRLGSSLKSGYLAKLRWVGTHPTSMEEAPPLLLAGFMGT